MSKAKEIFLKLYGKTQRGEISWEETEEEEEFQTAFPGYSIRIGRERDQYKALPYYYLKIFNEQGKLLEVIREADILGEWGEKEPTPAMLDLYEMARRIAMRVEEALDHILSELEGEGEHGRKK